MAERGVEGATGDGLGYAEILVGRAWSGSGMEDLSWATQRASKMEGWKGQRVDGWASTPFGLSPEQKVSNNRGRHCSAHHLGC